MSLPRFRRRIGSRITDNVGTTCSCLECRAAGADHLDRVRVPPDAFCSTPRWLHGEELRAWYAARDDAIARAKAAIGGHS